MLTLTGNKSGKKMPVNGPRHKLKKHNIAVLLILSVLVFHTGNAYGHGIGSETFPPTDLDGRQVTLEASSSQNDPDQDDDLQISLSFIDFDTKITLRDVYFHIRAERGDQFLFDREFMADNGFLVFNFMSENVESVIIEELDGNLFGSLLGLESRKINIVGPELNNGGLYKFDVSILAADGYSNMLDEPLIYNVGISIPQTVTHVVNHPDYGRQTIDTITYYDELSDFDYDISSKRISFSMPFEWTENNIEQTSVVHQELVIPKAFGDLLVSGFSMHINGIKLSDSIVSVDDFSTDYRTIHFIVNQKELRNVFDNNKQEGISFVIYPSSDNSELSSVTANGQFRVLAWSEPEKLQSGSDAAIHFDITDVFLKNKPMAVNYDFSVTQNGIVIFEQSGSSTDSRDIHNTIEFTIPVGTSGLIHLNFDNLDGNPHATTSIPIIVDSAVQDRETTIPSWIKSNAGWWSAGYIDDGTFLNGIEFLIQNDIILVPYTPTAESSSQEIPSWIKSNAGWWADGTIDDDTFVRGLQFLIGQGILYIS